MDIIWIIWVVILQFVMVIMPIAAYRMGLKDGLEVERGKGPEPVIEKIDRVVEKVQKRKEIKLTKVEEKAKADATLEGYNNIMNFNAE